MINSDKKKVTVDFHWTTENKEGTVSGPGFYVKHHHTEEYGPTISISETEDDYTSFPSKMFVEVVDFLRSEGVIEPDPKAKEIKETLEKMSHERAGQLFKEGYQYQPDVSTVLSVPVIENSTVPQTDSTIYIDNSNPITSFDSGEMPQDTVLTPQDAPGEPQTVKTASGPSDADLAAEMAAERAAAKAKNQSNVKTIKRDRQIEEK